MSQIIAKRYARALFELARENKKLGVVQNDLEALTEMCGLSSELVLFFKNPVLPEWKQKTLITELFSSKIDPATLNFLFFLVQKKRLAFLIPIIEQFQNYLREENDILFANVTSSVPLSTSQINDLTHHFKLKLRKELQINVTVDSKLLGGLKVQIADTIYDYTLQSQLNRFKYSLIHS